MEDGTYSGEYVFPRNQDGNPVHLPPFTTLRPPPITPAGKKAVFVDSSWELHDLPLPQWLLDYDFPPPSTLEWSYINRIKSAGHYPLFVHAYFLRALILHDDIGHFDSLVQSGHDQRAADRQRAIDTDNARIAMEEQNAIKAAEYAAILASATPAPPPSTPPDAPPPPTT